MELVSALLLLLLIVLVLAALLAPLESLRWWAGWTQETPPTQALPATAAAPLPSSPLATAYVVYLSGVAAIDPRQMHEKESGFLDLIAAKITPAILVRDIFPYSVTNNPLTGARPLGWLWRRLNQTSNKRGKSLVDWASLGLVTTRNMLQVLVSADPRYGPPTSFGVAQEITQAVLKSGYQIESRVPLILLGYSGGGQVAVGSVPYLKQKLHCPVFVIGIGGVYSDDPGILALDHLYQLAGTKDWIRRVGDVIFPGHWFLFPRSAWNRAKREGKITTLDMGPMKHLLKGDYFSRSTQLADGTSHADKTASAIAQLVTHECAAAASNRQK